MPAMTAGDCDDAIRMHRQEVGGGSAETGLSELSWGMEETDIDKGGYSQNKGSTGGGRVYGNDGDGSGDRLECFLG